MNRKIVTVALVAALALTLTGLAWTHEGCDDCDGECVDYPKRAHMPMLTAEQRDEVIARAAELDEQGASPEEVRAAIAEMLKEWGIQPGAGQGGQQAAPPRWGQQGMGMMQQGQRGMGMMHQGQQAAPPRWGQQGPPPQWGQQAQPPQWGQQQQAQRLGWQMIMQRLTPEQREQVNTKITELREQDATPKEIREALGDMLEDWGIQLPAQ